MVLDRLIRPAGWVVAGLAAAAAVGIGSTRPLGYDLVAYTDAAARLLAGAPLYPPATRGTIFLGPGEFLYAPTTAVLFVPLALVPADVARVLWTASLIAVATAVGWSLLRTQSPDVRPWAAAGYAIYLPLVAEITLGNLTLVTLALCLAAWHVRRRAALAGSLLALAVGAKLLPIAVPLFVAGAKRWRVVAWAAAVGGTVLAASLVWLAAEWRTYLELLIRIAAVPDTDAVTLIPAVLGPLRWALPLLAAGLALVAGILARDAVRAPTAFALALAAAPLAAPGIWYPYLVFAVPLLADLLRGGAAWRLAALAAWAALELPARPGSVEIAFLGLVLLIAAGTVRVLRSDRRSRTAAAGPASA